MAIQEYLKLTGKGSSIVDLLAMPDADEVEFEAPRLDAEFPTSPCPLEFMKALDARTSGKLTKYPARTPPKPIRCYD